MASRSDEGERREGVQNMAIDEPLHPAKFSPQILEAAIPHLEGYDWVLDPFAGVGRIHQLPNKTLGLEIEKEWADAHKKTINIDVFEWMRRLRLSEEVLRIPAIFTSPTYGNRFADHHNAKDPSTRRSYTHDMRTLTGDNDRHLDPNNSGVMQWGKEYRNFHRRVWSELEMLMEPGGRFVLNIKNHVRGGEVMRVAEWHLQFLTGALRMRLAAIEVIGAVGMRYGDNRDRTGFEYLFVLDKKGRRHG